MTAATDRLREFVIMMRPVSRRGASSLVLASTCLSLGLGLGGCGIFSPSAPDYASLEYVRESLDSSSFQARPMPQHVEVQELLLMYLPNRFLDLFDLFKVSLGFGPGTGLEIYLSENIWIGYLNQRSWRVALDGRASGIYEEGHYKEWHLGDRQSDGAASGRAPLWATRQMRPFQWPLHPGVPAVAPVPRNAFDVGASVHLFFGVEALVRPFEIFDFVVGLWGDDPAEDDYGLRNYPLHEFAPQGKIVDIFISAIDQMNEADLVKTLAVDLRRASFIRRGQQLIRLLDDGSPPAGGGQRPVGDKGQDYLIVGDINLQPNFYRNPETGHLDFAVRCTGAKLRWGVPAQIDYTLSFFNRFVRSTEDYALTLEVENEHWVITRIRDLNGPGR